MSTEQQHILHELDANGVASIILNRPQTHNAFDEHMVETITRLLIEFEANPSVKILVLKANGTNFSAGADLNWMRKMVAYSQSENLTDAKAFAQMLHRLYQFKKPTVALVQGATFGGGIGLIACCQIVIAAQEATFCFSEAKLGLIPAIISPYVVNAIGRRHAQAYFLTAQTFHAKEAFRIGLCQGIVDYDKLEDASETLIKLMLKNGPQALQAINGLMRDLQTLPVTPEIMEITARTIAQIRVSVEGQEGLAAFLEKRKPNWIKS